MIEEELDYRQEAAAMERIAQNLTECPELDVHIPTTYPTCSSGKVLTTSFCTGVNISQVHRLPPNVDLEDVASRLLQLYCHMVLVDGYYHADPHPGNILVDENGTISLLDFGAVARLQERTKQAIPELLEAVVRNDTDDIVAALRKMGFLGSDKASRQYVSYLVDIFKEFLQNEVELDGLNFQNVKLNSGLSSIAGIIRKVDLREVSNRIRIPKDYILLNRTVVLLIGVAFQLAPSLNVLEVVQPYIRQHVLGRDSGLGQLIVNTFKNQITTAIALPNELSRFLRDANDQDIPRALTALDDRLAKLHRLGQQLLYALGGSCLYFFYHNQQATLSPSAIRLISIAATVLGVLFIRAAWRNR